MLNSLFKIDENINVIRGLNNELKCLYIYNKFLEKDESILFLVNSLYEATIFYQIMQNYTKDVFLFPMDEIYLYGADAASPELKNTRLETIISTFNNKKKIIITNLVAYLKKLPPKKGVSENSITLKVNEEINYKELITHLLEFGYIKETIVNKTGEVAIRGFVLDIFPVNEEHPVRIELWGDIIESIRTFDENNQKKLNEISKTTIYSNNLKSKCRNNTNIKGYLTNSIVVVNDYSKIINNYNKLKTELKKENNFNLNISNDLVLKGDFYFAQFDELIPNTIKEVNYKVKNILIERDPLKIKKQLELYIIKKTVIICFNNNKLINKFTKELKSNNIVLTDEFNIFNKKINIINKNITESFIFENLIIISENDLFNKPIRTNYNSKYKIGTKIRDLNKLNKGDYVVHNNHGIGQYLGIKKIIQNDLAKDYIVISYLDNDKVYVPVEKIDIITKFSAREGLVPKLNKLGSTTWEKTKLKIRKRAKNIAESLLKLYAERETLKGYAFKKDNKEQIEFENEFEYKLTVDQIKSLQEIKTDMEKPFPMDRLLCGDVGFGKTEVAFRAMFKAILSGKQVAFLCPTTILSEQHYKNALNRFKSYPIKIVLLNRFVSTKDITNNLEQIKEKEADIVIGTHRLLSSDVIFKDLGLLVIDEEQRFGVSQKEKIKSLKTTVDVLTLTATPIPRTLQMGIAGIRNLSLIETPPQNRYPIQTYVLEHNDLIIRDVIYKEKLRNGQSFILYNNVQDMESKVKHFQNLMPEIKFIHAHGKMKKTDLEKIMLKFYNYEYDVLVCTTIIETGIDIPNVNSIIIMNADRFGLAQLYQIRGRVGRSNKIAYCYLMYPQYKILTEAATKRLKVIKEFTELGSGFAIATRDLSIRGAGDILGSEQAGFIDSMGIEMFLKILNEEIKKIKGEKIPPKDLRALPLINVETSISDDYVSEEELKIEIHKKINSIDSYNKLIEVKKELEDRFGKINEQILIYMFEEWFEKLANKLNLKNINQTKNFIEIEIPEVKNIKKFHILVTNVSKNFRLSYKNNKLILILDLLKLEKHFIYYLVEVLNEMLQFKNND